MRRIGALILAAGGSTRFGEPKQLLNFGGKSLVRRIVDAVADAGCDPIVVVAGDAIDRIRDEITGGEVIHNPHWQHGIGSSIRCGIAHIRGGGRCSVIAGQGPDVGGDDGASRSSGKTDAIIILACDQPFVTANTIMQLCAETKPIVASGYANTVGIPALFDADYFDLLVSLPDDSGAKSVMAAHHGDVAVVQFPEGAIDIDTPADYDRAMQQVGKSAGSFTFLKSSYSEDETSSRST